MLEQLTSVGAVHARKMFGDYALYVGEKVVGLICDDQLYIKYTDPGKIFADGKYIEGCAYPGAKPSMDVSDCIDDRDFLCELVKITADALPIPKPKKKRK